MADNCPEGFWESTWLIAWCKVGSFSITGGVYLSAISLRFSLTKFRESAA